MSLCLACFSDFSDQYDVCPFCGASRKEKAIEPIHLTPGTVLANRFVIGKAVGAGGFGITYKAWDKKLEIVVAVKEFFACRIMTRAEGTKKVIVNSKSLEEFKYRKQRFLAEAKTMAAFGTHKNIPNVFEFFEENGTAYIVMEFLEGVNLSDYIKQIDGRIDRDFSLKIINDIGNALITMHKRQTYHLDVAPDNIYICADKDLKIKLLDFGAAKLPGNNEKVVDVILKPGYSPYEQYDSANPVGEWNDIYALGATLYMLLTGEKVDEATNRHTYDTVRAPHDIDPSIPENLSNAVMKAIAVERHLRFKSVSDFLNAINGEKKVLSLKKEKKKRIILRMTGIIASLLCLCAVGLCVFNIYKGKKAEEYLSDAEISVWISAENDSDEARAMQSVVDDFTQKFDKVKIDLRVISESEYERKLREALAENALPDLFESTGLSDDILEKARNVNNVMDSEQMQDCLFTEFMNSYYKENKKQVPLGIEVPVAYVITAGATQVEYNDLFFESISDFGDEVHIAIDSRYKKLIETNFDITSDFTEDDFMNNSDNKCPVLLSSTMAINEFRNTLVNYQKHCVFPQNKNTVCRFTYEWSLGNGTKNENAAAERLLSWMCGDSYQNTLMISECNDGQIPINETCFFEKIDQHYLTAIKEIYKNLAFRK